MARFRHNEMARQFDDDVASAATNPELVLAVKRWAEAGGMKLPQRELYPLNRDKKKRGRPSTKAKAYSVPGSGIESERIYRAIFERYVRLPESRIKARTVRITAGASTRDAVASILCTFASENVSAPMIRRKWEQIRHKAGATYCIPDETTIRRACKAILTRRY